MADLVIWGAAGQAKVVADIVRLVGSDNVVGFIDDVSPERQGESFLGSKVLGGVEQLEKLRRERVAKGIVAVGDCPARLRLSETLEIHGFELARAVHPKATVARDAALGPGTVVCAGAVVGPGTKVGKSVIVNTAASVDHDCVVDDGAHIGPGAHLGGLVRVGRGAWIAIGATVVDRAEIGAGSVVGAGAVVLSDIPPHKVFFGVPAREKQAKGRG